ncbi:Pyridoxal 5'-phosphate synthase subunit PdxT [compost metagenome]
MADHNGQEAYQELSLSSEFQHPRKWSDIQFKDFDGLILPGGHAAGMKEYLESPILLKLVSEFFAADKPVGAICHGVVLAARSRSSDGRSVLFDRKTTALLASQEFTAWGMTALWLGDYYRTYKQSVQGEVTAALKEKSQFISGPMPLLRDRPENLKAGFTVLDKNYLSARWPGDAHRFANEFVNLLK